MSTSTASNNLPSNSLPSDSRSRPFRRLSQLRSYTQTHFSPSSSSTTGSQRASYRNSLSNRVPWRSSGSHQASSSVSGPADSESATANAHNANHASSTTASSCPEPERQSTLARYSAAFLSGYRAIDPELHSQPSSSSRSTPTNESGAGFTQGTMSRLRGFTQSGNAEISNANNATINDNDNDNPLAVSSPSGSGFQNGAVEQDPMETSAPNQSKQKPTIRFFPYQDPLQTARPSLHFIPISRTLPSDSCVIRVGRYSERDGIPVPNPPDPSDAPIGFKSKVVSRKHCELIFMNGQWHIKDVGSSSGTFLNHMRLSQPNMTSKLYTVKDGDIVQLGIDFRGGEEMIFRCVRIRIECNRSWQRQPNEFNKNTESLIRNLGKGNTADFNGCRECSICLGSVLRPYQCLFMAACAHVWHYKCVSRLIHTPDYPIFQCPNCRAYTDLSAEVDDTNDLAEEEPKDNALEPVQTDGERPRSQTQSPATSDAFQNPSAGAETAERQDNDDLPVEAGLAVNIDNMHLHDGDNTPGTDTPTPASTSNPNNVSRSASVDVPGAQSASPSPATLQTRPTQLPSGGLSRSEASEDNPLTPRNDTGPLAFDGWTGVP